MDAARKEARFWDQLLHYIEERRVIPLIGRDLLEVETKQGTTTVPALLASELAGYLEVETNGLPQGAEINEVACRYLEGPGRPVPEEIYSGLKAVSSALDDLAPPAPLVKLAEIRPLQLFVSTTFDPLLQRAIDQVRFGGQEKTRVLAYSPNSDDDLESDLESLQRPTVFHLLGRLSAVSDYAVTEEDTLEFFHGLQGNRPELLFDELAQQQLLIIGCSYPDWLARFFIRATAGGRLSLASGQNFVADAAVRQEPELLRFLGQFSARTQVYRGGGAVEFVDELHRRWTERHPPSEAAAEEPADEATDDDGMERGAIFLSYAREDLEAARAIKEALEEAGLDVWFDFKDLEMGDKFEQKIRDNIERCSIFLALISRQTTTKTRGFFRLEWDCATREAVMRGRRTRFLVPVIVDDETAPDDKALPDAFRDVNCVTLPDGHPTAEFVGQLRKLFREHHKERQGGTA